MRHEPNLRIENFRVTDDPRFAGESGKNWGLFQRGELRIISSGSADGNPEGRGWEHVSVSHPRRCPTWEEMCKVKEMFWPDDETVVQFHPRKDRYYNCHPYCLHLWKMADTEYVLPPKELL